MGRKISLYGVKVPTKLPRKRKFPWKKPRSTLVRVNVAKEVCDILVKRTPQLKLDDFTNCKGKANGSIASDAQSNATVHSPVLSTSPVKDHIEQDIPQQVNDTVPSPVLSDLPVQEKLVQNSTDQSNATLPFSCVRKQSCARQTCTRQSARK